MTRSAMSNPGARISFRLLAHTAALAAFAVASACSSAHAIEPRTFCDGFAELFTGSPAPTLSLAKRLRMALLPRSLVRAGKLKEGADELRSPPGSKVIFVQLPAPARHPELIESLEKRKLQIARLELMQELRSARTSEQCLQAVTARPEEFGELSSYLELFQKAQPALDAERDHALRDLLLRKLRRFERQGWRIESSPDLFAMYRTLEEDSSIREVMLVAHSDDLGRLYDSKQNILPKGAFSNLPGRITKLIVYSCHAEMVAAYYEAARNTGKFDYYFPEIREDFGSLYNTTIPVAAIRGMLRAGRSRTQAPQGGRECGVRISMPEARNHLVISLNGTMVGASSGRREIELQIDCALTASNDTVKIYYLGTDQRPALSVSSITLRKKDSLGESSERTLTVREFVSSQTGNHLLTQGT